MADRNLAKNALLAIVISLIVLALIAWFVTRDLRLVLLIEVLAALGIAIVLAIIRWFLRGVRRLVGWIVARVLNVIDSSRRRILLVVRRPIVIDVPSSDDVVTRYRITVHTPTGVPAGALRELTDYVSNRGGSNLAHRLEYRNGAWHEVATSK